MSELLDVFELIPRVRAGDEIASAEFIRRIEPYVQRVARIRMGVRGQRGRSVASTARPTFVSPSFGVSSRACPSAGTNWTDPRRWGNCFTR